MENLKRYINYIMAFDCICFFFDKDGAQENSNDDAPENNPAYTTVYIGNLAHEVCSLVYHICFQVDFSLATDLLILCADGCFR